MTPCLRPNGLVQDGDTYEFIPHRMIPNYEFSSGFITIGCGSCISCRIKRGIGWKIRGIHEQMATFHPTYMLTLTYDEDHLPSSGSLRKSDLQSFHRRLRYASGHEFRFMACGEYGPTTGRAHYHGVYFGLQLPDVYKAGPHLVSKVLSQAWGNGQVSFHLATPASIAYVAGYVVKKLRSDRKVEPIMTTVDYETGLITEETPVRREFFQASNRPGIGSAWIEQFGDQVLSNGFIIMKEKPCYSIPTFYLKKLRDLPGFPAFQEKRIAHMKEEPPLSPEELSQLGIRIQGDVARRSRSAV